MQQFIQGRLFDTTILATVLIAFTSAPRLLRPIRSVVWVETAAPCRVEFANHTIAVFFSKARSATKAFPIPFDLIRLALKRVATRCTSDHHTRWFSNYTVSALPGPATFTITKVMCSQCAWRYPFFFIAPLTNNSHRWMSAFFRAIMELPAFCMPTWAIELFVTSSTSNHHSICLFTITYMGYYTTKERSYAGYEKDVIAYWQQRRWELQNPATPITAKSSVTMDGQLDMFLEEP